MLLSFFSPPSPPPHILLLLKCSQNTATQLGLSCKKPRLTWNDQPCKLWPFELVLEALTTHTHDFRACAHTHMTHVHTYTHTIPFLASEHKEEILFTSSLLGGGVMVQHLLLHTQDSEGLSQQLPVSSQPLVKVITHTDAPLCAVRSHISPSFSHQVTYLEGVVAGALVGGRGGGGGKVQTVIHREKHVWIFTTSVSHNRQRESCLKSFAPHLSSLQVRAGRSGLVSSFHNTSHLAKYTFSAIQHPYPPPSFTQEWDKVFAQISYWPFHAHDYEPQNTLAKKQKQRQSAREDLQRQDQA